MEFGQTAEGSANENSSPGWARTALAIAVVYAVGRNVVAAAKQPFGFDEVLTSIVSSLPNWNVIREGLNHNLDSQPPFFYVCERIVSRLIPNDEIALRLFPNFAFPCAMLCVFAFARRRWGAVTGFLCATFLLCTSLFHTYAIDARGYSMVVACIALAMVFYDNVSVRLWPLWFALSLFLAESFHYYAVFSMIPFGIAEIVVLCKTRRFRATVWGGMALACLPVAIFWRQISSLKAYYGSHLFIHNSFSALPVAYGGFFLGSSTVGTALALLCVVMIFRSWKSPLRDIFSPGDAESTKEKTLALALVLLPILVYVATSLLHSFTLARYAPATILGISLTLGMALAGGKREASILFGFCLVFIVGLHEYAFWRGNWKHPLSVNSPAASVEAFVNKANHAELPVVVGDGFAYLPLTKYASADFASRMVCLVDEQKAVHYLGNDTLDKNLLVLLPYHKISVLDFNTFTSEHRQFLLYREESPTGFDWVSAHLTRVATLEVLEMEGNRGVFLVNMNKPAAESGVARDKEP